MQFCVSLEPFERNCTILGGISVCAREQQLSLLLLFFFFLTGGKAKHISICHFPRTLVFFGPLSAIFFFPFATASAFVFEPKLFGKTFAQQPKQSSTFWSSPLVFLFLGQEVFWNCIKSLSEPRFQLKLFLFHFGFLFLFLFFFFFGAEAGLEIRLARKWHDGNARA